MLSMLIYSQVFTFLIDVGHCEPLGAHPTILALNKLSSSLPSPQTMISFTAFGHMLYMKHHFLREPPHHFVRLPPTQLSLNLALIPFVGKLYGPIPIHICMISSTLGLSPHGFVFRLFPKNTSYQLDIVQTYILISLPIHNRCRTL